MDNWHQFKYRSLWQHPSWAEVQKGGSRKIWTLEKPNARALVIKHELPFSLSWLEVPRGPLFKDEASFQDIMKEIQKLGEHEKSVFIRFSSYQNLKGGDFRPTTLDHHPQTSLIIDLEKSEEEILEQMKPKGRYNIKLAEKHDVKIEPSDDVDAFYELLSKTGNRDGFGIHPKSYYLNMMSALGQNGLLLLARYEDHIIAGGIFVYLDEWGIYYYGASNHHYRNVMAPYLLQWYAIKEAKTRSCKSYDFLGIAPEGASQHAWAGVTDFKKKFGGYVTEYPMAKDLVLRPYWYIAYRIRKCLG